MRRFGLLETLRVAAFLTLASHVCHSAGSISVHSPQRNLIRSVQEDVLLSVSVTCSGIPTMQWTFMSGAGSRFIGTIQPGLSANVSSNYSSRATLYENGSMALLDLQLQDSGYYVLTVTEAGGSSKDVGFVLKVNEVLYEDLQYLSVTALALAFVAGLLMLVMWLLHKACQMIRAWRRRKQMPENDETELDRLDSSPANRT